MSLRAELVRLGLRWLLKPTNRPGASVAERRQRIAGFERWTPQPPGDTQMTWRDLGGVPALCVATPRSSSERHILFLHGGGYVTGTPRLYRHVLWRFADAAAAQVWALQYRLAPEHPFPAALDDAVAGWRGLLGEGARPEHTAIMGDSAGGGLAFCLALRLLHAHQQLPAAIVALSPWTDLALTGASLRGNAAADPMQNADDVACLASWYLDGADPRNPYASPLYGDLAGLPPTLIQVGSDEILRDDSERMAARMREAGCAVDLEVWPRMPHVWHSFASVMPEARQAVVRIGNFVKGHTPLPA